MGGPIIEKHLSSRHWVDGQGEVPWRLGLCYAKENVKILIMSRGSSTLTSRRSRAQRMRKNCGKFIDFDFRDRKQKRERIK